MLYFALFVTALIGILVILVATGLVTQKISYRLRSVWKARLDELYLQKVSPILLEDFPTESLDPTSLLFRQNMRKISDPLRVELSSVSFFFRRTHRAALKRVMLGMSHELVGETRARLTLAFQIFEFVKEEVVDLNRRRWWIRARACRNVALMKAEDATADLRILLKDDEEDVRNEAAMALVAIAGVKELRTLLTDLPVISVWTSVQLSKVVLSMASAAVPDLIEGLKSNTASIRRFCVDMLGEIGDISACEPLIEFARTADTTHRAQAFLAIGKLGDEKGKDTLLQGLADEEEQSRMCAARGLGYLASPDTASHLKDHLLHDTIAVRLASGRSLERIEGAGRQIFVDAYREADTIGKRVILQFLEELGVSEKTLEKMAP